MNPIFHSFSSASPYLYCSETVFCSWVYYFEFFFAHKGNTTAVWAVKDSTFRWWEARSAKAHNETKLILKSHMKIQEYLVSTYIDPSKNENLPKIPNEWITFMSRIWIWLEFKKNSVAIETNTKIPVRKVEKYKG